jgi:hypothetical protein
MIEGSGSGFGARSGAGFGARSGSVSLTNGSGFGSGKPRNMDPTDPDPQHCFTKVIFNEKPLRYYLIKEENAMLVERVAQLEEQLLGGEGDGQQQQLRLQAEDHLLERSKLRSTERIFVVDFPEVTVLSSPNHCRQKCCFNNDIPIFK